MQAQIIRNAIATPDGTFIESKNRFDYNLHKDAITDELYFVDGGKDYFRGSINTVQPTFLHVTTDDPFEVQREAFTWGSYGKEGTEPLQYIKLKDMTTNHIAAVLVTQKQIKGTYVEVLFNQELEYRYEIEDKE